MKDALLTFVIGERSETWVGQVTRDNDGTGLGGRRFVRSLEMASGACPSLSKAGIGTTRQLIYSAAQSLQQAEFEGVDHRIIWAEPVFATAGGPPPPGRYAPMHSDLWDALILRDYCPPSRPDLFVANDGGVFRGTAPSTGQSRLFNLDWKSRSEGLRTHTAQNLLVVESGLVPPPMAGQPFLPVFTAAYSTQDNEGWWRDAKGKWNRTDGLGMRTSSSAMSARTRFSFGAN